MCVIYCYKCCQNKARDKFNSIVITTIREIKKIDQDNNNMYRVDMCLFILKAKRKSENLTRRA